VQPEAAAYVTDHAYLFAPQKEAGELLVVFTVIGAQPSVALTSNAAVGAALTQIVWVKESVRQVVFPVISLME